jgi:hypothetical protein
MFRLNHGSYSFFALLLLNLLLPRAILAQVDMGAISGSIKDTSGGVVAGAKVTLSNEATGVSITTTSSSSGEYSFSSVKIGRYSVLVEYSGFQKAQQNNITVDLLQTLTSVYCVSDGGQPKHWALQQQGARIGAQCGPRRLEEY